MARNFRCSEYNSFGELIGEKCLDEAISWIQKNCSPKDIFEEKELIDWAKEQEPSDIFSEEQLSEWAEDNEYVKEQVK